MSGVALGVPGRATQRSFFRLLLSVLAGYFLALVMLLGLWIVLHGSGILDGGSAHAVLFPPNGAWTVAANIALGTLITLVAAWWVRAAVANATLAPVSFEVVFLAVAVTGVVPAFLSRLLPSISVFATTWIVRRFAVGLPSRLGWRAWAAVAAVAVALAGSYSAYHPISVEPWGFPGIDANASGTYNFSVPLKNAGLADVTILRIDGGYVGGHKLPWTLNGRSQTDLTVSRKGCVPPDVTLTYSVLGSTLTQRFVAGTLSSCRR